MRWHPRNSLQARLSRSIALGVALLWLAATVSTVLALRHEMDEVFDSALQELAERMLPLVYQEVLNRDQPDNDNRAAPVGEGGEHLTYLVRDAAGAVLIRSHDANPALYPAGLGNGFQSTETYRFYTVSAISGTLFVTIAEPLEHRQNAIWQGTMTLLWPLALLLPLSLIGVWLLVRRTLRSVLPFRAEIGTPGQGYLTPVAAPDLPAEIALLAVEVNNLIDRLRRALAAERSFTASAAHELRTPVAAALAQTQRLIAELDQGLLQDRAKAEGAGLLAETGQDLVPVLRLVLQDLPDAAAVDLIVPSGPVESLIDLDALAILARNLMKMPCATAIPTQRSALR